MIFRKCVDENRQMSILPLNILRGKMGCLEISEEHISVFKNLPNGTSTALHTPYVRRTLSTPVYSRLQRLQRLHPNILIILFFENKML